MKLGSGNGASAEGHRGSGACAGGQLAQLAGGISWTKACCRRSKRNSSGINCTTDVASKRRLARQLQKKARI